MRKKKERGREEKGGGRKDGKLEGTEREMERSVEKWKVNTKEKK